MPIVAAVGRSKNAERIVSEGARLSEHFDTKLHVLHVAGQYESTERVRLDALDASVDSVDLNDDERAETHAASIAGSVTDDFTAVGLVGYPEDEILRYATEHDAEYIVIGGRKRSPIGKALFGSTAQAILLEADRSVVAVPPVRDDDES